MFKKLGKLEYIKKKKEFRVSLNEINLGINFHENFIIYKNNNQIKVYNRKCDHAGGKIISKKGKAICPVHLWEFNPSTGNYHNGVKKKEAKYSIDKNILKVEDILYIPSIDKVKAKLDTEIRFFNHAFLKITGKNFSFSTDPWAIGPAFNTGWWLKYPTKDDWIDELNNSSFIYISHNHSDHLHPLTLRKVSKNIPIVVPNFISKSTELFVSRST